MRGVPPGSALLATRRKTAVACLAGRSALLLRGGSSRATAAPVMSAAVPPPGATVEVYSTSGCRYCAVAKAKLKELRVPFTEIDVTDAGDDQGPAQRRKSLADRVGRSSVPQIFVAGEHVGGCDELLAAVADGSFETRLSSAGILRDALSPVGDDAGEAAVGGGGRSEAIDIELAPKDGILNYHEGGEGESGGGGGQDQDAAALAQELQARTLKLFDEFVTVDGRGVGVCARECVIVCMCVCVPCWMSS